MKPAYRRAYERFARTYGLSSTGRRKVRRENRRHDRMIRRVLMSNFAGCRLTPEVVEQVKAAIAAAINEGKA
ncbi:TPA: hypothetical protein ACVAA2_005439 [Burkholderia contaminans]